MDEVLQVLLERRAVFSPGVRHMQQGGVGRTLQAVR